MKIIIITIGLMAALTAAAQDSLSYYMTLAAENNPEVLQQYYAYQAALQKVPQVGSLPDPELSVGVFLSPMELVSGNQLADLRLMQLFPWFGTLRAAKDEMSLMANAKYESFRKAKLQVFYEVQSTWYDLYKVQRNIHISEKSLGILRTIERLALVKFRTSPLGNVNATFSGNAMPAGVMQGMQSNPVQAPAGGSPLADLYRIQIEIGELENNTYLLREQQNTLVALFNSYLNRPARSPVSLPDSLVTDMLDMPLEAIADSVLMHNPMLAMIRYEQKSLDSRKIMVTKMGYPMIGLGLNYSVISNNEMSSSAMNGKDMLMPMVSMTLPVYRKKYRAMQHEADLLKAANAQDYTASANGLITEYYQAIQLYHDAQRRVALYANQSLLAGKSLDILIESFAASGAGLTDILRVRQQTLEYDYKQAEAVADYNTAIARLKQLMAFQLLQ